MKYENNKKYRIYVWKQSLSCCLVWFPVRIKIFGKKLILFICGKPYQSYLRHPPHLQNSRAQNSKYLHAAQTCLPSRAQSCDQPQDCYCSLRCCRQSSSVFLAHLVLHLNKHRISDASSAWILETHIFPFPNFSNNF